MCFSVNIGNKKRIQAAIDDLELTLDLDFIPSLVVSGFEFPKLPVVLNDPYQAQMVSWGLIPAWTKSQEDAHAIRAKTLNARCETLFDLPSFRTAARTQRCVIIVNGFYEWRHEEDGKTKTRYHLFDSRDRALLLAGLWETWRGGKTCTIVTMAANTLMSYIHNVKKRMPVMLERDQVEKWLEAKSALDMAEFFKVSDDFPLEGQIAPKDNPQAPQGELFS